MILMFFMICGVLKNRERIKPAIRNVMIRDAMKHPMSLTNILRFNSHKLINLGFYLIGNLPANLSVQIIKILGKKKHVL